MFEHIKKLTMCIKGFLTWLDLRTQRACE